MQEDFLHYIWNFKKFDFRNATTVDGRPVIIINGGAANLNSGPDFFNAKIQIGEQMWAGNVEIHVRSADWYSHQHETDPNYDNVVLHVVWEDNMEIFRKDNSVIPTLELKNLVTVETMKSYRELLLAPNAKWINCEKDFPDFDDFQVQNWLERMYLEKLEQRSGGIKELLERSENNWEAVLFILLARGFGLKVNGEAFLSMAQSLDFSIVQKCRNTPLSLEALFFGQSGLLDKNSEDGYFHELKKEYNYLKRKFGLNNSGVERPKYFRLRPENFPNIRLSQFAVLYSTTPHLFSKILVAKNRDELLDIFRIEASVYWSSHYNFGKRHSTRHKMLSADFTDLLIINTIVPLKFSYFRTMGRENTYELLNIMQEIKAEKNSVIEKYNLIRPNTAVTAIQSQGLLHLKKMYCDRNFCLKCSLGSKLIRG
ncbi:MAG: DUF2851 family protein [Gillisia sp.]